MTELKRSIGFVALLSLSVSSIIGTGLFFGPAIGAGISGNASILAWLILALVSVYVAACFGELVSIYPLAGGIYEFAKQTYGRFISFIVGWIAWLTENMITSLLIVAAITYLLPEQFPSDTKIIISLGFIILLNVITYIGLEASSIMVITFTIITLFILAIIIFPGLFFIKPANLYPFFTHSFSKVFLTIFFIAETFFGYEAVTFLAEETKNPERVIPKALIIGTMIVALSSLLLVVILIGTFHWSNLAKSQSPLLDISNRIFGGLGDYIGGIGIYLILLGSAATGIVSAPRLLLALARDRLFLPQFSKIHKKFYTPYRAIIFQAIVSVLVVILGYGKYQILLSLVVPMGLILYITALMTIPILRFKKPNLKRVFKVPFGKIGPIIVSLFLAAVIVGWVILEKNSINLLAIALSLIAIGIPLYFLLALYYDPDMLRIWYDFLAYLVLLTERIAMPIKVRKQILALMGNIKGKIILEFGCSVGTLTLHLAEEVGPNGIVYATDISKRELDIAHKRMMRRGHKHVIVLHDKHHTKRVHPDVPEIHTVVSAGCIGYLQDIDNVLSDMNRRLKKGSKVCFVDYDRFFELISNVQWLSSDEKIKSIFHKNGFTVAVMRKQGFAWKYIYIYGTKFKNV